MSSSRSSNNKGRTKRTSASQISQNDDVWCDGCNKYIKASSLRRHAGQCRARRAAEAAETEEAKENAHDWLKENRERDISDVGNLGAEDNISMNEDIVDHGPFEIGFEDSCDEDDDDDEDNSSDEDGNDDEDTDAILKNDDTAPPELLVKTGKQGDNLEGKVVKVSEFTDSWMNCLGEKEFDYKNEKELRLLEGETAEAEATQNENDTAVGVWADPRIDPSDRESDHQTGRKKALIDEYRAIPDRMEYRRSDKYCCKPPKTEELPDGSPLKAMLLSPEGNTMGLCYEYVPKKPEILLNKKELSMIRLVNYCDQTKSSSRDFINGFLDILAEEIKERQFDPKDHPKRETISRKVMKTYGGGCQPKILHVAASNEAGPVVTQEDTIPPQEEGKEGAKEPEKKKRKADKPKQVDKPKLIELTEGQIEASNLYKAIPKEINNRERFMLDVICFNAKNMILDLLDDHEIFGNLDNLVVNATDPYMPYKNDGKFVDEVLDGMWYRDTVERLKSCAEDPFKPEVEFILPIMMYVDKTGTSMNQRYPLEPFIFTTAIIRRKLRNKPSSWRPLGFIPDLETKSSAERAYMNRKNVGASSQAYHQALGYLLEGMEEVQNKGILTYLCFGDTQKKVRIRPEVACIINDGKSADMTTLRQPGFFPWKRVSRCCTTVMDECDLPTKECTYLELTDDLRESFRLVAMSPKEVQEDPKYQEESGGKPPEEKAVSIVEEAKAKLIALGFHPVRNAFIARCIRFGLDPRNIWGANPIDLMHAFQSGILMYVVKMVLDKLKPKYQMQLDRLVHKLFHRLRSKDRETYPRVNFTKGFSKLTMITSDEWAGKLFVTLIVLHTDEGKEIFKKARAFETNWKKFIELPDNWDDCNPADMLACAKHAEKLANEIECKAKVRGGSAISPSNANEEEMMIKEEEERKEKKKGGDGEEEEMLQKCSQHDFIQLAEALLCFHAWYKMGVVQAIGADKRANTKLIQNAVAKLLGMVRWYAPRKKGNRWKLQKFHDLLHLAIDIERFGLPSNFDAGPMESGLRYWAKLPAMTSQMRGYNTFAKQVAMRTYEFQCFSKAMRMNGLARDPIPKQEEKDGEISPNNSKKKPIMKGTTFRVYATSPTGEETSEPGLFRQTQVMSKGTVGLVSLSPVIENYLRFVAMQPRRDQEQHQGGQQVQGPKSGDQRKKKKPQNSTDFLPLANDSLGAQFWELKTEACIYLPDQQKWVDIRCHPNFGSEGPWYDWVVVNFAVDEEIFEKFEHKTQYGNSCVPCKVLSLAENPKEEGDVWLLVHGCHFRTKMKSTEQDSVLFEHWNLAYQDVTDRLSDEVYKRFMPEEPKFDQHEKDKRKRNKSKNKGDGDQARNKDEGTPYRVPQLCWVRASSVHCRCFVIEEEPGVFENAPLKKNGREATKVLLVRPRANWANEFL